MWSCDKCNESFGTFQAKANHVRWKHKHSAYTDEGLQCIKENARATATKRYGEKTIIIATCTCKCGAQFEVMYSPERKGYVKKTCSKECAARREQTPSSRQKKSVSMKRTMQERPELRCLGVQNNNRFSSKAERALAESLASLGFKRHKHVTVEGLTFDIDIVSGDGRVWIESDGEWHFRQVHVGHDYEATKLRDRLEEREAANRGVLLIRVNNQTTSIDQQVEFIKDAIQKWDGIGKTVKFQLEYAVSPWKRQEA